MVSRFVSVVCVAAVFMCVAVAAIADEAAGPQVVRLDFAAFAKSAGKPLVDKSAEGYVRGRVLDAATGTPVAGAAVLVQEDGKFP